MVLAEAMHRQQATTTSTTTTRRGNHSQKRGVKHCMTRAPSTYDVHTTSERLRTRIGWRGARLATAVWVLV